MENKKIESCKAVLLTEEETSTKLGFPHVYAFRLWNAARREYKMKTILSCLEEYLEKEESEQVYSVKDLVLAIRIVLGKEVDYSGVLHKFRL